MQHRTLDSSTPAKTVPVMVIFLLLGIFGLFLLLLSMVFDGILDVFDGDGLLSAPAIAAFLTSLGFVGALAAYAGLGPVYSTLLGAGAGVGVGFLVSLLARSAQNMNTDATPSSASFVGLNGSVVTAIPAGGFGEISLSVGGQPVKLAARCDQPVPAGVEVRVVSVLSPTSVTVTAP